MYTLVQLKKRAFLVIGFLGCRIRSEIGFSRSASEIRFFPDFLA